MKKTIALLMAFMLILTMSGCAKKSAGEQTGFVPALDTEAKVTVNFIGGWGNFEALDQVALNFNEYYPNVEIVYSQLSMDDIHNRLSSNTDIDIIMNEWMDLNEHPYLGTDQMVDFYDTDVDVDIIESKYLVSTTDENGKLYAIPLYEITNGYMVNVSLLESYGLEVPSNLSEFKAVCDALLANGVTPIMAYPAFEARPFFSCFMSLVAGSDDPEAVIADFKAGNDSYGYFEYIMNIVQEYYEAGYYSDEGSTLEDNYDAVIMRFFEGDVPFMSFNTVSFSGTKKREAKSESFTANPFEYEFIPSLAEDGYQAYYSIHQAAFIQINGDSENADYAKEFVRFMYTDEQLRTLASVKNLSTADENDAVEALSVLNDLPEERRIYRSDVGDDSDLELAIRDALGSYHPESDSVSSAFEVFVNAINHTEE